MRLVKTQRYQLTRFDLKNTVEVFDAKAGVALEPFQQTTRFIVCYVRLFTAIIYPRRLVLASRRMLLDVAPIFDFLHERADRSGGDNNTRDS